LMRPDGYFHIQTPGHFQISRKETPMAVRKLDRSVPDSRAGVTMRSDPTRIDPRKLCSAVFAVADFSAAD